VSVRCGEQGKGRIGKDAFVPWTPQAYICDVCGYIYEVKRGEPRQKIMPGTPFESLPDSYACPVCGDHRVRCYVGKIGKDSFKPLML
jgi:rubredoxin